MLSDKIKKAYRKGGLKLITHLILVKIFPVPNPLFYWSTFVMMKITKASRSLPKSHVGNSSRYQASIATRGDIVELIKQYPKLASLTRERANDPDGPVCAIVKLTGTSTIVGFAWIKFVDKYITNSGYIALFEGKRPAWGYGFYVHKNYRGTPVILILVRLIESYCVSQHCTGIFAETHIHNLQAIRVFGHIGMHVYETITFLSILGLKIYIIKDHKKNGVRLNTRWTYDTHRILSVEGT